jgi:hypothetical protein
VKAEEVIVMAKSAKRRTDDNGIATPAESGSTLPPNRSTDTAHGDIASRAYDLYLARGCAHGHDVDDWLQAERELRDAVSATAA